MPLRRSPASTLTVLALRVVWLAVHGRQVWKSTALRLGIPGMVPPLSPPLSQPRFYSTLAGARTPLPILFSRASSQRTSQTMPSPGTIVRPAVRLGHLSPPSRQILSRIISTWICSVDQIPRRLPQTHQRHPCQRLLTISITTRAQVRVWRQGEHPGGGE